MKPRKFGIRLPWREREREREREKAREKHEDKLDANQKEVDTYKKKKRKRKLDELANKDKDTGECNILRNGRRFASFGVGKTD